MGRGSDNDIVIDCGSVSGTHAEMHRIEGGYELRDVGSTNGIKLGGERYDTIALRHGSTLKIGDAAFDFVLTDEEREALARENAAGESPTAREIDLGPAARLPATPQGRPHRQTPPRLAPIAVTQESGGGWMVLLLLLLAAAAFFAGLSIRHQKETGTSLVEGMRARFAKPAPASAPAAPAREESPVARATPPAEADPIPAVPEAQVPDPEAAETAPGEVREEE